MREVTHNFQFSPFLASATKNFLMSYLQRFKSKSTQESYCLAINEFSDYIKKDLLVASSEDCRRYILHLEAKRNNGRLKNSTLAKKKYQLSSVYSVFCEKHSRKALSLPENFMNHFSDIRTDVPPESFRYEKVPNLKDIDTLHRFLIENDPMTDIAILLSFKGFLTTEEFRTLAVSDFLVDASGHMVVRIANPAFPLEVRYNSIPEDIKDILMPYFDAIGRRKSHDAPKLFSKKNGSLYTARALRLKLQNACEACGIPRYTFNDFRNAGVVYAVSYHADISIVANSLGYKSNTHLGKLSSLQVTVNDAAELMGISFKPTYQMKE